MIPQKFFSEFFTLNSVRYQTLYKTLLEKSEELQVKLAEQKEESKNIFIESKKNFEDKGMEAFKHKVKHICVMVLLVKNTVVYTVMVTLT